MNKIQIRRLTKLRDHLLRGKLAHKRFDFSCFNSNVLQGEFSVTPDLIVVHNNKCGTNGCAIGELPLLFPRSFKWKDMEDQSESVFKKVVKFFGITDHESEHLFIPYEQCTDLYGGTVLGDNASRTHVAKNITVFLRLEKAKKI